MSLTLSLTVPLTEASPHTPHCTPAQPAQASSHCTPPFVALSNTPPSPLASHTCTSPPLPPHTSLHTHLHGTPSYTRVDSSSAASHTPSHTRTDPHLHSTSHSSTSFHSNTVSSLLVGKAGKGLNGNTPMDMGGRTCVVLRRRDDILRMGCRHYGMAKNSTIWLGRHTHSSHVFHTPIIDHISHHKKQGDFGHSKILPPSYDLLHTVSQPSRDMASKVILHDKWLCIDVRIEVSGRMGENMEGSSRDGSNGPEFWSDGNDWVFGINRGNLGRRTDETPYRERRLLFFHIHMLLLFAWYMSDRHRGDKVAGMCVGHNLMSFHKSTHHVLILC